MNTESWLIAIGICAPILVAMVGATAVWATRVSKGESAAASAKEAHARLDDLQKEFADYREHVAREYVSHATIRMFEDRISSEFERLRQQLDRLFQPKV